jgi:hypothetical protein
LEGFVCLEEYHLEDLIETYDAFVLHPVSVQTCTSCQPCLYSQSFSHS